MPKFSPKKIKDLFARSDAATTKADKGKHLEDLAVYLFEMVALRQAISESGVKVGVATSVRRPLWDAAQIHPVRPESPLVLSPEQGEFLLLFGGSTA